MNNEHTEECKNCKFSAGGVVKLASDGKSCLDCGRNILGERVEHTPEWEKTLTRTLEEEKSSIYWKTSPVEYERLIEIFSSLLEQTKKEERESLLAEITSKLCQNCKENVGSVVSKNL